MLASSISLLIGTITLQSSTLGKATCLLLPSGLSYGHHLVLENADTLGLHLNDITYLHWAGPSLACPRPAHIPGMQRHES